jgi:RNA polymerase sigma-70 factor, ECF subfamily
MSSTEQCVSDGELIRRTADRDAAAFDQLYRRHSSRVLGVAMRRLRDRARAEDAAQEAFAAVWRSARSFRPERGNGTSWFYAVVRNAIIDQARRTYRGEVPEVPDMTFDGPGPDAEAEGSWIRDIVHGAVSELPENEATVIALAYWQGLSQSEVAAHLDIPLGTVKTRTRSALARLADALEDEQLI